MAAMLATDHTCHVYGCIQLLLEGAGQREINYALFPNHSNILTTS